jgi:addiction module HigA family antidote
MVPLLLKRKGDVMRKNGMRPVPPGEILNEEFLKPLGMTANALAKAIGVPTNRIAEVLKDERGITGEIAVRFSAFFNTSAEFWMNLQMAYDLRKVLHVPIGTTQRMKMIVFV